MDDLQLTAGRFDELGGSIYALTHLGVLWGQPELLDEAEELTRFLPPLIERDVVFDIMGGSAGCMSVLLALHACRPSDRILEKAIQGGDHLLAGARRMERGIGWPYPSSPRPLAGFSHGAAGAAHALLQLSAATGERRFREAALEALAYERGLFSPEVANWPDLRNLERVEEPESVGDHFMTAWCHGAPGIGLARVRALDHLPDDPHVRTEIRAAVKTTLDQGFGMNHSLCHGALGNLELPLEASMAFDDAHLRSVVYKAAAGINKSILKEGWLCGVPDGIETHGLMPGLAGIGYGFLRLAEPEKVPSVMLLDHPPCSEKRPRATPGRSDQGGVRP